MKIFRNSRKITKYKLSIKQNILLLFIYSVIISFACLKMYFLDSSSLFKNISQNFYIFILNFIPIFLFNLFLGILINDIHISSSITGFLSFLGSLINRYKIIYRDEPFTFNDIQVYKEAMSAVSKMNYSINFLSILILLLITILPLIVLKLVDKTHINKKAKIFSLILLLILSFLLNIFIYSNSYLYNSFNVYGSIYRKSDHFKSKGFVYSFIYNLNQKSIVKPKEYNKENAEELISNFENDNEILIKPNIICILSESFMDPSILPNLELNKDDYVLKNYEKIKKESILRGNVIVKGFGGGTAYTEFEVLTGINPELLSVDNPFEIIKYNIHSIPNVLKDLGYKSIAMHPGQPWFYNRQNAYKYLGFDEQYFIEYYDKSQNYVSGYISEEATFDFLINKIEENSSIANIPYFYNLVTIQNHGPYDNKYTKYPNNYVDFSIKEKVSNETYNVIKNYLLGLKDCDTQIGRMTTYLNKLEDPYILIYYGDHLPYLGENYLAYKELGLDVDNNELIAHSTPYLIWVNKSCKKYINTKYVKTITKTNTISVNYLPIITFNIINFNKVSAYFSFVNNLFDQFDIIFNSVYIKDNNTFELTPDLSEIIKNWSILEYYYLKEKNIEE